LERIASTMDTGSWVNFYACQLTGLPPPLPPVDRSGDAQCQ